MQAYSNIWLIPSNKTTWTLKDTLPKTDRIQDLDNKSTSSNEQNNQAENQQKRVNSTIPDLIDIYRILLSTTEECTVFTSTMKFIKHKLYGKSWNKFWSI
jgi:hypothetical protein